MNENEIDGLLTNSTSITNLRCEFEKLKNDFTTFKNNIETKLDKNIGATKMLEKRFDNLESKIELIYHINSSQTEMLNTITSKLIDGAIKNSNVNLNNNFKLDYRMLYFAGSIVLALIAVLKLL
jgi:predicted nuclease with TOPRIM domain